MLHNLKYFLFSFHRLVRSKKKTHSSTCFHKIKWRIWGKNIWLSDCQMQNKETHYCALSLVDVCRCCHDDNNEDSPRKQVEAIGFMWRESLSMVCVIWSYLKPILIQDPTWCGGLKPCVHMYETLSADTILNTAFKNIFKNITLACSRTLTTLHCVGTFICGHLHTQLFDLASAY